MSWSLKSARLASYDKELAEAIAAPLADKAAQRDRLDEILTRRLQAEVGPKR